MISHDVVTRDGVTLALHRLDRRARGPAVVLVHGAFSGHTVWLRGAAEGFGRFLAARGYDVWLADLRGHGASAREPAPHRWRFEDWIREDAPAILARVRGEARGPIAWVGHSSGGAVGLCVAARSPDGAELGAVVTFGTPGPRRIGAVRGAAALVTIGVSRAAGRFPARLFRFGPEDEAAGILGQWMGWNVAGNWRGADGFDHFDALARVRVPYCGVAGAADRLFAPARACRQVYDALGSERKEFVVARPGFDHRGLLLDARGPRIFWPRVADWIAAAVAA